MIYWCKECNIPLVNERECNICGNETKTIAKDIRPVFKEEKKVVSIILGRDVINSSVWNRGSVNYIIDGETIKVDYVKLFTIDKIVKNIREEYKRQTLNFEEILNVDQFQYVSSDDYLFKFVEANRKYIKNLEYDSQKYILELIDKFSLKRVIPTVSFSGGKDSTVISNLVRETYGKQEIFHLFGDTTLEFRATYNYIDRFKKANVFTPFIISSSEKNFFNLCKEFGPPSRLERWCCTIFKTSVISESINILEHDPENTYYSLSFLGIRASESVSRGNYEKTRHDSKISRQIVSMPILEWLNIDVWLYILYKKLDFNAAYTLGFSRVGCWCCPNNSTRSDFFMKLFFHEDYSLWHDLLISYAKKARIVDYEIYVNSGKWKSRRGLRGLTKKDISIKQTKCNLSNNSRIFFLEKDMDKNIIELFKPFGAIKKTFENKDLIMYMVTYEFDGQGSNFKIYIYLDNNTIKIEPLIIKDINLFYKRVECQLRKYEHCMECQACDSVCPFGAINTTNRYTIDEEKCTNCLNCVANFNGGCLRVEIHKSKI